MDNQKIKLIETLMDMVCQYCHAPVGTVNMHKHDPNLNYCLSLGISAGEDALKFLVELGFAEREECGCYRLLWDKIPVSAAMDKEAWENYVKSNDKK